MNVRPFVGWLALALGLAGCPSGPVCTPGATQRCVCPSGDGAQTCNAEGSAWEACRCDGVDGGTPDGGTPDGGGGDTGVPDDAPVPACAVGALATTITAVNDGTVGSGVLVRLDGVVAMTAPFLVAKTATNDCIWGTFVSAPGLSATAAGTGLFVTSYGTMATIPPGDTRAYCPMLGASGSAIPDDLSPGDVLTLVGTMAYEAASNCASVLGGSMVPQRTLGRTCFAEVTGTAPLPTPATISPADAVRMASPTDAAFHDAWAGVMVRLTNVDAAVPAAPEPGCTTGTSVVRRYGEITLDSSGLVVSDRLYYQGLLADTDPCHATPLFCTTGPSHHWSRIDGIHYLNGCVWGVSPADKCGGMSPPSEDCVVTACE
jgi:hypothetical protein